MKALIFTLTLTLTLTPTLTQAAQEVTSAKTLVGEQLESTQFLLTDVRIAAPPSSSSPPPTTLPTTPHLSPHHPSSALPCIPYFPLPPTFAARRRRRA